MSEDLSKQKTGHYFCGHSITDPCIVCLAKRIIKLEEENAKLKLPYSVSEWKKIGQEREYDVYYGIQWDTPKAKPCGHPYACCCDR